MGCCQTRDTKDNESTEIQKIIIKLEKYNIQENWSELAKYIEIDDKIDPPSSGPLTVGGLALSYLKKEAEQNPNKIQEICIRYTEKFLKNLERRDELASMTLAVFIFTLNSKNSAFHRTLVGMGIFDLLNSFFSSGEKKQKIMASSLAGKIYARDPPLQDEFFKIQGHIALVEMIKAEVNNDTALIELLEEVKDLVYDRDGKLNHNHLMKLRCSDFFDVLNNIQLDERNPEIQEAIREFRSI